MCYYQRNVLERCARASQGCAYASRAVAHPVVVMAPGSCFARRKLCPMGPPQLERGGGGGGSGYCCGMSAAQAFVSTPSERDRVGEGSKSACRTLWLSYASVPRREARSRSVEVAAIDLPLPSSSKATRAKRASPDAIGIAREERTCDGSAERTNERKERNELNEWARCGVGSRYSIPPTDFKFA